MRCVQDLSDGLTTGFCCQKLIEAEALLAAGISDLLISNEVVGPLKIQASAMCACNAWVVRCPYAHS